MAVEIKYNGAKFPDPQPFVAIGDTIEFVDGKIDYSVLSIDVIGQITGANLGELELGRRYLTTGLAKGFKTLEIGTTQYTFAQPNSLEFDNSNLASVLPYQANFTVREKLANEDSTTLYTGLSDLQDSWSFSEQENNIVEATHTVSAKGHKISAEDPLIAARRFVSGRINNHLGNPDNHQFVNFSVFLSGQTGFLMSRSEQVDRVESKYGITDTYNLSISEEDIFDSGILQTESQINWTKDGGLAVSLRGSIKGGLTGYGYPAIGTGMFTVDDAKSYASRAVERSKSDFESTAYGTVFQNPRTFEYEVDDNANTINFNFEFVDPDDPRTSPVKHEYTTNIRASKDSNVVEIDVDGELFYDATDKLFDIFNPETGARFLAVSGEFEKVNPYSIARRTISVWVGTEANPVITGYMSDFNSINPTPTAYTVNKSPFEAKISYNASYNNNPDITTGSLENVDISFDKEYSINTVSAKPTIGNYFAVQSGYYTIPEVSVSASAEIKTGASAQESLDLFENIVEDYIEKYSFTGSGVFTSKGYATGIDNISINRSIIYPI